jgi:hypothetical protein
MRRRVRVLPTALKLFIFTFSALTSSTFVLLTCVPVGGHAGRYLFSSADTECYQWWQGLLFVLLTALVLLPLAALLLATRPSL